MAPGALSASIPALWVKSGAASIPAPAGLTTANSPTTVYVFDALGQRTSVTDPLGNLTSYQYDLLGRKITETLPDPDVAGPLASPIVRYTYDDVGNPKTTTDALNQVTTYDYDNL